MPCQEYINKSFICKLIAVFFPCYSISSPYFTFYYFPADDFHFRDAGEGCGDASVWFSQNVT